MNSAPPLIVISGDEDEATRRRVRECGATDFISKSADATETRAVTFVASMPNNCAAMNERNPIVLTVPINRPAITNANPCAITSR